MKAELIYRCWGGRIEVAASFETETLSELDAQVRAWFDAHPYAHRRTVEVVYDDETLRAMESRIFQSYAGSCDTEYCPSEETKLLDDIPF